VAQAKLKRELNKRTASSAAIHERSVAALDLERRVEEAKRLGCGAQNNPCATMPEFVTHEMRVHVHALNTGYLSKLRKAVDSSSKQCEYPVKDYKADCEEFDLDDTVYHLGMTCAWKRERFAEGVAAFIECARGDRAARDVLGESAELLEGTATHYTVGVVLRMANEQHVHEAARVRRQAEGAAAKELEKELEKEYAPPAPPVMEVYTNMVYLDAKALAPLGETPSSRSTAVGSDRDTDSAWGSEPGAGIQTYRAALQVQPRRRGGLRRRHAAEEGGDVHQVVVSECDNF